MNWLDFWSGAAANTIGSIVGVIIGVPIALGIERNRQRRADAADRERREQEQKLALERLRERFRMLVALLVDNIDTNLKVVERLEIDVGYDRPVYRSDLELETWDVLKPDLLELIDDPAFVVRLAALFAKLHEFAAMLSRRAQWVPGYEGFTAIREEIVRLGPHVRADGRLILHDLRERLV
jgi:hypothetical protein